MRIVLAHDGRRLRLSSPITFDELMELRDLCEKNYSRDVEFSDWINPPPGSIDYEVTKLCQRRLAETRDVAEQPAMGPIASSASEDNNARETR